jgi:hypothetical protein
LKKVNLKVKIHVVDALFAESGFRTRLWVSEEASAALAKFSSKQDGARFLAKLKYYAKGGFDRFVDRQGPIRPEWGGVFRIGQPWSLFRLVGFFDQHPSGFVVIDAFTKRGQKLSAAERERIDEVAKVKKHAMWRKRNAE